MSDLVLKKFAIELCETEQIKFSEAFYAIEDVGLDDLSSPCPWGCPWLFGTEILLRGNSIEDMAKNFFLANRNEILELISKENE